VRLGRAVLTSLFFVAGDFALAAAFFAGALFFVERFGGFVFTALRFTALSLAGLSLADLSLAGLTLGACFFDFLESFFLAAMAAV
jgi:hypothetical protein